MVYVKQVKIKGKNYWYLFHTVRKGTKFLKRSRYLGKEIPSNLEEIKKQFLEEINKPKERTEDEKLIESLTPLERKAFPLLDKYNQIGKIIEKTRLKEVEVLRAVQWLEDKSLVKIKKELKEIISLDKNGEKYIKKGLPEKQFLQLLPSSLEVIRNRLDEEEVNVSIGTLKKKSAILFGKKITITDKGKKLLHELEKYEEILKKLPLEVSNLSKEEKLIYNELKNRKEIIKVEPKKIFTVKLTELGSKLIKQKIKRNLVEALSPDMLAKGGWKGKTFRRFNIESDVPNVYPGRRHFVKEVIEYVKKIWLELGFKEMTGSLVQTSFWNFDSLFVAQDHPSRDLQDTFFVRNPSKGSLLNKELVERISKTHENGWTTGSRGWQYKWDIEESKKNTLRTHTTVLSARTISALKKEDLPAKFFAVGKCFRNETLDWSHLFEFNQVEGIVIDPNANFRHLVGYLKEFYYKMGYKAVRVRPAYFPYTEPSAEVEVLDPARNEWIELGGAGIFRPEVVKPLLGKEVPVLAWGLGFARIVPGYYGITDIRGLYKNNLKQLREIKAWLR